MYGPVNRSLMLTQIRAACVHDLCTVDSHMPNTKMWKCARVARSDAPTSRGQAFESLAQ